MGSIQLRVTNLGFTICASTSLGAPGVVFAVCSELADGLRVILKTSNLESSESSVVNELNNCFCKFLSLVLKVCFSSYSSSSSSSSLS